MPAIRLTTAAVFAFLLFLSHESASAQSSHGNRATIRMTASEPITAPASESQESSSIATSDGNQARLLLQAPPVPKSQALPPVIIDQQVSPASFFVQDKQPQILPQGNAQQKPDEEVNPFDPDVSSRPGSINNRQPPSRDPRSATPNAGQALPLLPGSRGDLPSINMPEIIDLQPVPNNFPGYSQPQPEACSPGLALPMQQFPASAEPVVQPNGNSWVDQNNPEQYSVPEEWQTGSTMQFSQTCCSPLFYLDLFGGTNNFESDRVVQLDFFPPFDSRLDYKGGYSIGGRLGIYQGQNLRTDFELSLQSNDVSINRMPNRGFPLNPLNRTVEGQLTTITGFSNAYWDFVRFPVKKVTPYVGAGIGFLRADADFLAFPPRPGTANYDIDSSLAWQFIFGASWRVTSKLDFFGEYRVMDTNPLMLSLDSTTSAGPGLPPQITTSPNRIDLSGDSVVFGIRMKF